MKIRTHSLLRPLSTYLLRASAIAFNESTFQHERTEQRMLILMRKYSSNTPAGAELGISMCSNDEHSSMLRIENIRFVHVLINVELHFCLSRIQTGHADELKTEQFNSCRKCFPFITDAFESSAEFILRFLKIL